MDEQQSDEVFDSAYELYQEIRDDRGLHLRDGDGRDDVLYQELRDLIGCHDEDIADFLKENDRSAEWLLRQFLQLAAPFASMFTEIWDFLSSEKSPRVTEDLRVRFGFDGDDVTEVDMEQFREWAEIARKISVGVNVAYWSDEAVHELFDLKNCVDVENQHGTEYRRGEPYKLPIIETRHGDEFEEYVRRIRNLFQQIIDELAKKDNSHNSAFGVEDPKMPLVNLSDLLPGWEPIFKNHHMVSEEDRRQAEQYFREQIEPKLEMDSIDVYLNYQSPLDILRLPFWEKRWHTYEIWMTVQTIKALEDYDPQVRINDGRIPIDGRDEAVVADLERIIGCEACIVSELRTPYETEEREAIQPDLSICRIQELDEESRPISTEQLDKESRVVIVEYKQHERLSPSHAEERAESYLDGSPEAVGLVMVNYDERTDVDFPDKAKLIGNIRPGSPKVKKYHETVQELINDVKQFESLQQWTVLLDVSGSMNGVYMDQDVKNALLKLFDMDVISLDVYKFTTGLTENPQVSRKDVKSGLHTTNGTDAEGAIKELCDRYNTPDNLLVITDLDDISLDSLHKEPENMELCAPRDLLPELDSLGSINR
jgi:hypothetical protein